MIIVNAHLQEMWGDMEHLKILDAASDRITNMNPSRATVTALSNIAQTRKTLNQRVLRYSLSSEEAAELLGC